MRRIRNRQLLIADLLLLTVAAYVSYVLRLERADLTIYWRSYAVFAIEAVAITALIFKYTGVYSRYWRYASINELLLLTGAVTASVIATSITSAVTISLFELTQIVPRSIPFIFLLLALTVTAGPRLFIRIMAQRHGSERSNTGMNVLVMGAGDAGSMIAYEILRNPRLGIRAIGFLDDDVRKHGMRIHGLPVLGDRNDIPVLAARHDVSQVIIAMPAVAGKTIREIIAVCEQARVRTKIVPGICELLEGTVSVKQLRDVQIEDLLRRAPVSTDAAAVGDLIRGKRVLITGGGGSIGGELCRQVLHYQPSDLVVVGHGENSIFEIYGELRRQKYREGETDKNMAFSYVHTVIADIRFPHRIQKVFEEYRPDIVFHAAAHKHVPLMEANPSEAITNNVLGTRNVLNAAMLTGVERFVMISSDKAVNPTSIMGVSKRVAELLVHQAAKLTGHPYVAVRFGNVLGSRGSVVHTFRKQIANGGPVTITHPDMTRYFMTIPEAVQLVLQAAVLGQRSEVFLLDMGEPIKIVDLARDLIELSGLEVERDIDIIFTSTRPGEKLYEELFIPGEQYRRTRHQKIFVVDSASNAVDVAEPDSQRYHLAEAIEDLEEASSIDDRAAIISAFKALVPEYQPSEVEWEVERLVADPFLRMVPTEIGAD